MKRRFTMRREILVWGAVVLSLVAATLWTAQRLGSVARSARSESSAILRRLDALDRLGVTLPQLALEHYNRLRAESPKDVYLADARRETLQARMADALSTLSSLARDGDDRQAVTKLSVTIERYRDLPLADTPPAILERRAIEGTCLSQIALLREYCLKDLETVTSRKYGTYIRYILAGTLMLLVVIGILLHSIRMRLRVERELTESRSWLNSILSNNPGAIYRCAPDHNWTMAFISDGIERISGYAPAGFIDNAERSYASIIHPDDVAIVWKAVHAGIDRRQSFEIEYRIQTADGSVRWVYEKGKGIYTPAGTLLYLDGSILDITDRKDAETERNRLRERLEQGQKMESIGQLAGGVAHDFNNLLTPIIGYAGMIMDETPDDSRTHENAAVIQEAGERAAELTRHLLAFSRRQILQLEPIDVNAEITALGQMLRRLIRENIELTLALPSPGGKVKADRVRFQQMLMNLAINAQDAMPQGGTLTIGEEMVHIDINLPGAPPDIKSGDYIKITVADTGCGMTQETLGHIFEPFFTTKEKTKGTGLGLAMVFGNVKQHDGYIDVRSEPGTGSVFSIYLPSVDAEIAAPRPVVHTVVNGGGKTVLVVEDHDMIRSLTNIILKKNGFVVFDFAVPGPALAFARAHEGEIDLALIDVVLPGMTGPDFYAKIKERFPQMLVIYTSGYADQGIVEAEIQSKGISFLPKPYTSKALLGEIQRALEAES